MPRRARTDEAKEVRRRHLLAAALDEFYERGFSGARIDDIARRAGLSKGTVYLYFASKEALFTELIHSMTAPPLANLEALAGSGVAVEDILHAFARFAAEMIEASSLPRLMKVLIGDSHAFPETITTYREVVLDKIFAMLTSVLAAAKARGEINIGDPALTARVVVAPIILSGVWTAVFNNTPGARLDVRALLDTHVELLVRAMTTGEKR